MISAAGRQSNRGRRRSMARYRVAPASCFSSVQPSLSPRNTATTCGVKARDGKLWFLKVRSAQGRGTMVTVEIPFAGGIRG